MTEQEAKTKWCPMVRLLSEGQPGQLLSNRPNSAPGGNCIGSGCMMWRIRRWDSYPDGQCPPEPADGYCGLAGKP